MWSSAAVAHLLQGSTCCAFRDGILHYLGFNENTKTVRLVSYCIASLVSVCACLAICCDKQESVFSWIQIVIWRPPREKTEECEDHRLYRAPPPGRDTVKGYKYRFLFIFFLTACFISVIICITNSYYVYIYIYMGVWLSVMLESFLYSYLLLF